MKDSFWFPHDSNAKNDPRLIKLRMRYGFAGLGQYWCLIEFLRDQNDYEASIDDVRCYEFSMGISLGDSLLDTFIDCELLENVSGTIFSRSLKDRMVYWDERRKKLSDAGKRGGRPRKKSDDKAMIKPGFSDDKARSKPGESKDSKDNKDSKNNKDNHKPVKKPNYTKRDAMKAIEGLDWIDPVLWDEWLERRKKMKMPITERTTKKNIKTLQSLGTHLGSKIIEQTIDGGWKDFYALKSQSGTMYPKTFQTAEERAQQASDDAKRAWLNSDRVIDIPKLEKGE
jgi:hypothetical protein